MSVLIHGTADKLVPFEQSERYEKKLKQTGGQVKLLALEGAGHNFGSGEGGEHGHKADAAALELLDKQLRGKTTPVTEVSGGS
jgi:dipeptidyl aminopeptidase/acylaminoacyl peptidase